MVGFEPRIPEHLLSFWINSLAIIPLGHRLPQMLYLLKILLGLCLSVDLWIFVYIAPNPFLCGLC